MKTLVLLLEALVFPFGALAYALSFLFSPRRAALSPLAEELPERFGRPQLPAGLDRPVWVHCASAGEVNAAAALIARLDGRGLPVAVTSTTAAGRDRARTALGAKAAWLAPLDFFPAVDRFLSSVRPRLLIVVETELWPAMIARAARRGAPCVLVNARMTERSRRRYKLFAPLVRPFVAAFSAVAAQTEEDATRFRELGARGVVVCGNMKHEQPGAGVADSRTRAPVEELGWGSAPVFCAGSTHPAEEAAVIEAYLQAKEVVPGLKLIIAPRHVERSHECAAALDKRDVKFCSWSARQAGCDALLVDRLGHLGQLYALSTAAFVGGTLVPVGGHNVLEPALAGVPVLFGPSTENTSGASRLLESAGGGFCAADAAQLGVRLVDLAGSPERAKAVGGLAKKTARTLQGAVDRTLAVLDPYLNSEIVP